MTSITHIDVTFIVGIGSILCVWALMALRLLSDDRHDKNPRQLGHSWRLTSRQK